MQTTCPKCKKYRVWKNGHDNQGNQKILCKSCGYVWTEHRTPEKTGVKN